MTSTRTRLLLILSIFSVPVLVACGDDGGGGGASTAASTTTAGSSSGSTTAGTTTTTGGSTTDPGTGGTGGTGDPPIGEDCDDGGPPPALSFATDIQPIFTASCSCHLTPIGPAGLDLTDPAFDSIVDVASMELPAMDRIEPGDPANSYIFHKLRNTQLDVGGLGTQMPRAIPPLDAETQRTICNWIRGGAMP